MTMVGFFRCLRVPITEFDKSIVDFPNIKRFPGGASNDMNPNLQDPANPVPLMDIHKVVRTIGLGDSIRQPIVRTRGPSLQRRSPLVAGLDDRFRRICRRQPPGWKPSWSVRSLGSAPPKSDEQRDRACLCPCNALRWPIPGPVAAAGERHRNIEGNREPGDAAHHLAAALRGGFPGWHI